MEVIIEVSPETAHHIQMQDQSIPAVAQFITTIDSLNVTVKPQYRDKDDTAGNYYFVVDAESSEECQRIATLLGQLSAVEAAYCKPEAEPALPP